MGSFNTTCAVSHSPIREGDKVRLFFLASQPNTYKFDPLRDSLNKGCQCYAWDDFKVIGGISLEAKYSDYNNYEFDEDSIYARYIRWIIRTNYSMNVPEEGKEYNEYHDHMNVPVKDLTWEQIFDMQHSGRLFLKGYGSGPLSFVGIMAIHESVYQIMLNEPFEVYVGREDGNDNPYKTVTFETALAKKLAVNDQQELDKLVEQFKEYTKDQDWSEEKKHEVALRMAQNKIDSLSENHALNYAYTNCQTPYAELRDIFTTHNAKDESDETKVNFGDVTLDDIKAKTFEGVFFNGRFDERHFMYRPLMTSGQEHDLVRDGIFWSKVSAAIGSIGSEWEEEEHVVTRKISKSWQETTVSEVIERLSEWYEPNDKKYIEVVEKLTKLLEDVSMEIISVEQLKSDEYKFIRELIWNTDLELRISR
ncbi:hypothetical protein GAP32_366 [Cronobacter phage vB_CsaM_GAP32]|uniref:Uncharacterized protein n=1 Tax=Cronobacter phage vB_CsaM_GAP32 TaxID=1141136 RepID=K4F6C5_9CAUD|nr:hypothetical protein GAP32_366 [Cronobacter phage vB_CsaM_GAP32]AFC21816.1 hypothetical protein GAP32_366 [Cronobacter phage vB_CsaM_GAP32]